MMTGLGIREFQYTISIWSRINGEGYILLDKIKKVDNNKLRHFILHYNFTLYLLPALANDNDFVPAEAVESTTIVSIAVAKSDGDD